MWRLDIDTHRDVVLERRIGELLTSTRLARGWSQGMLARKAGVSRGTVSRYELSKAAILVSVLDIICAAMNVDAADVIKAARTESAYDAFVWEQTEVGPGQ